MKDYGKKDIQRILRNNGYTLHHQKGSHLIYKNVTGRHLTVRFCDCNKMLFQRLIKEYGLVVG